MNIKLILLLSFSLISLASFGMQTESIEITKTKKLLETTTL